MNRTGRPGRPGRYRHCRHTTRGRISRCWPGHPTECRCNFRDNCAVVGDCGRRHVGIAGAPQRGDPGRLHRRIVGIVGVQAIIIRVGNRAGFDEWQEREVDAGSLLPAATGDGPHEVSARRKCLIDILIIMACQRELLEVIGALHSPGGFAGCLDRRQQQGDQDGNDRDHDEKLDERETTRAGSTAR